MYAYSEANVAIITVIIRKAYGGGYIAMNSSRLRADFVFAWPSAEIAVMGAKGSVEVIFTYKKEIAAADDKQAKTEEKIKEYENAFNVLYLAAQRGHIDDVILPSETRARLIDALKAMHTKAEVLPAKKHGNIPL